MKGFVQQINRSRSTNKIISEWQSGILLNLKQHGSLHKVTFLATNKQLSSQVHDNFVHKKQTTFSSTNWSISTCYEVTFLATRKITFFSAFTLPFPHNKVTFLAIQCYLFHKNKIPFSSKNIDYKVLKTKDISSDT